MDSLLTPNIYILLLLPISLHITCTIFLQFASMSKNVCPSYHHFMTTPFYILSEVKHAGPSDVNSCLLTASPPRTTLEPRVEVTLLWVLLTAAA